MNTWRKLIAETLDALGLSWSDVINCTLSESELDVEFDSGYEAKPFCAWTQGFVIFPACYDFSAWAASAPRNPGGKAVEPVGGG